MNFTQARMACTCEPVLAIQLAPDAAEHVIRATADESYHADYDGQDHGQQNSVLRNILPGLFAPQSISHVHAPVLRTRHKFARVSRRLRLGLSFPARHGRDATPYTVS